MITMSVPADPVASVVPVSPQVSRAALPRRRHSQRARVLLDIARAHLQRRNVSGAIGALLEAERLTPEQVRTHRLVKNMLYDLVRSEHRTDPRVRGLAGRCGVSVRS
jgi:hypothetical protein